MSGDGIHWIVNIPSRTYGLGKSDTIALQSAFPASPMNQPTAAAGDVGRNGIATGDQLANHAIKEQYNTALSSPVNSNDLFGDEVSLNYNGAGGAPDLNDPDQVLIDASGRAAFAWAPNIASPGPENGLNPLAQPDSGIDAAVNVTDGTKAGFNGPPAGTNPKTSTQQISVGVGGDDGPIKIGTFRLGKRTFEI